MGDCRYVELNRIMVPHTRDGYTFVSEGRVDGEEEIGYIIASGGHAHHLFQIAVER